MPSPTAAPLSDADGPRHDRPLPIALPMAKLQPPAAPAGQVLREALRDKVCAPSAARVVLVRAPAGFGKTTAMLQCQAALAQRGCATAWLTLDKADNDPSRFLAGVAAALASSTAASAMRRGARLSPPPDPGLGLALLDRLAADDAELVLFLDDLELVHEGAVLNLLRELVERLPRRGRLVIGSRSLPDIGLGRLRARGLLLELDTEALRFSFEETAEFLQARRQLPLPASDLLRLHDRTEGWAAALWLASLALQRREARSDFIERFSGSDQAIADYLAEDVLSRQSPAVRDFLLRTSILRQLGPRLCDALRPEGGSAAILAALDAANVFVTPVDHGDGAREYRYHPLFADFLRAQLEREPPVPVASLHRAASRWYEAEGRPVPAIDHAIEAGDTEHALDLLAAHAEDFLAQGRLRLLTRWFAAIPAPALARRPGLHVVHAWALCFTRGPWDAMALLQQLGDGGREDAAAAIKLTALRPALLAMMDRFDEAHAAGETGLAQLPPAQSFAYAVLSNAVAYIGFVHGRDAEARRQLDAARQAQGRHASRFNVMYSESVEGLIDLQEGRLREAASRFRMAVFASPGHAAGLGAGGNAWAGVLHAMAVYEGGELAQAERLLHVYVPLARDVGLPDHMIIGHAILARIAFEHGSIDRAFQWLIELEYLGHQRQLPRVAASARLERARLLLLQGHAVAAAAELDRADDPAVWQPLERFRLPADVENIAVGRLRWQAFVGDAALALPPLQAETVRAVTVGSHRRALKLRLLQAVAQRRAGQHDAARTGLRECLQRAQRDGWLRLVVDEGEPLGLLVAELAATEARTHGTRDPLFADYLQRLCRDFGLAPQDRAPEGAPQHLPLEPLTPGELRVLQLLADGCSNGEMAERLSVSDSTVRTHLRNINGKLDTSSRAQALVIARRLGLVG